MTERRAGLEKTCREYGVELLYSFGSRAQEARAWLNGEIDRPLEGPSDLDVGAKMGQAAPPAVSDKVRLAQELEELFGISRVDLVILDEADPFLAAEIIRGEILFFRDRRFADEYELFVLRRAGDLAPLERERIDQLLRDAR